MATEDAADFLTRTNFKSIIEWMTAEYILHRPDDPLVFMRNILDIKVSERGSPEYKPEDATGYVRKCYAEASASADEHGRIHGKVVEPPTTKSSMELQSMSERMGLLEKLISASRTIASKLDPFEATENIIQEAVRILDCDRATLYRLDDVTGELVLMVAEGAQSIRLPVGQGVAGAVAASGIAVNVSDVYADSRFDSTHDAETGYETKSVLAVPVINGSGKTVGVLQALNKNTGATAEAAGAEGGGGSAGFNDVDEEVAGILSAQAGIALTNAQLYKVMQKSRTKVRDLLDVVHAMHNDMGITSLIFTINNRAHKLVDAHRNTIYMVDAASQELWSMQGDLNIRIPMSAGLAGAAATEGKTINIVDAYEDPRFNQEVDKKSGYRTRAVLCMPIFGGQNNTSPIGVIQLINKDTDSGANPVFTTEDEEMMGTFLDVAGPMLQNSQLFQRAIVAETKSEMQGGGNKSPKGGKALSTMGGMEEGDEEEEEDVTE